MLRRVRNIIGAWFQEVPDMTPTRELPLHLWRAVRNFFRSGSRQAAALAYYAIFSVFPLVLLLAVAVGSLVGPAVAREQIANGLSIFLPDSTVADIQDTLQSALEQSTEFGIVAALGLIWAATGLFSNITAALDSIFEVPAARSIWRQRLLALLMGLTLVVLVVASFLTSGVLRLIAALSPGAPSTWISISTVFLPLGLNVVIFALLFRYVPTRYVHWDAVWPAALFGAVGWELAKSGFEWYLTNLATYSIIYGSIATGIVLLFWAYLIASIFLLSAEICARLNEWQLAQEARARADTERNRLALLFRDFSQTSSPVDVESLTQLPEVQEIKIKSEV